MDGFWMELHCHCSTGSGCAKVDPQEIPDLYKKAGYSGVVITDHFRLKMDIPGNTDEYKQRVDRAVRGYHIAKSAADPDFTVLLGAEMSLSTQSGSNHFLVYGLDEAFLYNSMCMTEMTLEELKCYLHKNGKVIYQAHPFRDGCSQADPKHLDGAESFNDPRSKGEDNLLAEHWAKENGLPEISGSDFHEYRALASGGVCFEKPVETNDDLLAALKSGRYSIKRNDDY